MRPPPPSPDPRSQLAGLPGVPPGQRGAQLPPHAAAGDQSLDRPLPGFAGGLREGRLQDEQLVHRHRPAAGEEAGGEHRRTLQVGQEARIFVHSFPINTPVHIQNEAKSSMCLHRQLLCSEAYLQKGWLECVQHGRNFIRSVKGWTLVGIQVALQIQRSRLLNLSGSWEILYRNAGNNEADL